MRRPRVVLAYSTAALALAAQWIAAKVALAEAPPLELATVRFAIASAVLVVLALVWVASGGASGDASSAAADPRHVRGPAAARS